MPYHDSPSPVKRPSMSERTASTHSLSRASPTTTTSAPHKANAHKPHKTHSSHGRLPHTRNPSYGKNLNKLTKLTAAYGGDGATLPRVHSKSKIHTPSTSPSTQHVKRNSSNVSLPRAGSKVSVKRNSSNLSLKRNGSGHQLGKSARPETPLRRSHSHRKDISELNSRSTAKFTVGNEDQDEEWTEESNSQSPSTTRHSSVGPPAAVPKDSSSEDELSHVANLPDSPPQSVPGSPAEIEQHLDNAHVPHYSSRHPEVDAVTSRLLNRHAPHKIAPQMSSISATATPGNHTPPQIHSQDSTLNVERSMPENGISRFLNPSGSSGSGTLGSVTQLHTALNQLHKSQMRGRKNGSGTPPPETDIPPLDHSRRVKSANNLPNATTTSQSTTTSPPSYEIPPQPRRKAGNTQFRLDLWRGLSNKEPSQGPPIPLIQGVHGAAAAGSMSAEERRMRQWEVAEQEMECLRRFRNPLLEGVSRAVAKPEAKKAKMKAKDGERGRGGGAVSGGKGAGERVSRPASAAGRGRVRFEIGGLRDGGGGGEGEGGEEGDAEDAVQQLLRRMWEGVGAETVGGS
ncbi:hypothetical protein MMC06_005044 [Schaereria dolodes]|nr:hypothetical protein [Schaereria dolodes]